jgi:hypothetical protein
VRHPLSPALGAVLLSFAAIAIVACNPPPTSTTSPGGGGTGREPNAIVGRVTTETGQPVAGASLRIVGYTGGAGLGRDIETVTSEADGTYRYEVPKGLYEVLGDGPLTFDGQTYLFHLDPADGSCEQAESADGIAKDFVLRLQGFMQCLDGADPNGYLYYHGATVQAFSRLSAAGPDDVVEYVLEPSGPLADGRAGETLTMQRTVAAHSNTFGPLESTSYLHDIPLGRYELSASLLAADGSRSPLLVSSTDDPTPSNSVQIAFAPRLIVGTLSVGYSSTMPAVTVSEGS